MGQVLSQIAPVVVKKESTIGTDPTPAGGTDDLLTYDSPTPFQPDFGRLPFNPHSSSFTKQSDIITTRLWRIAVKTMLMGSGGAGDRAVNGFAALDALMLAAGCKATVVSSTSITYAPATIAQLRTPGGSSPFSGPATIKGEQDGKLHEANNVFGNIVMSANTATGVECNFTGSGLYNVPTHASISSWAGGTNRAQPFINISGTINDGSSYTPIFRGFNFDMGVEVGFVEDGNATNGISEVCIVDRNPTLTVDIGMDTQNGSNLDYEEIFSQITGNSTTHDVAFTVGSATGNTIAFTFNDAQPVGITSSSQNKKTVNQITYKLRNTTAEAEWNIAIT